MQRRAQLLGLLWIGWMLVPASAQQVTTEAASAPGKRPRIVLYVLFDTLGGRHVSHLGYERATTPQLDQLAEQGVLFSNAVSPAPYAVASIPSLLTGRYPDRLGMTGYGDPLPASEVTLAEQLSAAGYRSVGFSSVYNGGPAYGNDQGFDRFVEMYRGPGPEGSTRVKFEGQPAHYPVPQEYIAPLRAELDALDDDSRLFLFVHFLQPHGPYDPPLEYLELFRDERYPGPYNVKERAGLRRRTAKDTPSVADREGLVHLYDGNVAFADAGLGLVLEELRSRDLFDEALIVATGNHGEAFWEHDRRGHGVELFEELMHVPLVLKLPASHGIHGLRRTQLVSNLDLTPTLLDCLGLSSSGPPMDGQSLLGLLDDSERPASQRRVFMRSEPKPGAPRKIALRWDHAKVIVTLESSDAGEDQVASSVYFDLAQDAAEQRDVSADDPQRTERAAREAFDLYRELQASHAALHGER